MARAGLTVVDRLTHSHRQAVTDDLTGLGNRRHLLSRAGEAIQDGEREVALLLIDLDGFKELNDTLGHSRRRRGAAPDRAAAGGGAASPATRWPGSAATSSRSCSTRATRRRASARPACGCAPRWSARSRVGGIRVHIDASIGIALFPEHARRRARPAAARRRRHVRGQAHAHRPRGLPAGARPPLAPPARAARRAARRAGRRRARPALPAEGRDRDGRGPRRRGARALGAPAARAADAERLPAARRPQRARPLADGVRARPRAGGDRRAPPATASTSRWRSTSSPADLLDLGLPSEVARVLEQRDFPASSPAARGQRGRRDGRPGARRWRCCASCARSAWRPSLDDFGSGHVSLGHLKHLGVDEIKIDRSFVMRLADDDRDAAIVHTTVDLGRRLGMRVVAEGVETRRGVGHARRPAVRRGAGLLPRPADDRHRAGRLDARPRRRAPDRLIR